MKFSLLHISDLHRDLTNELGNAPLLESPVRDVEQRYAKNDPAIPKPSLCIVSGDLVYGAKPGSPNFADELKRQYRQAREVLVGIADQVFEGYRNRIIDGYVFYVVNDEDVDGARLFVQFQTEFCFSSFR